MSVLDSTGLLAHLEQQGVSLAGVEKLEPYLQQQQIPYHRDSQGEIWVSIQTR